MNAKTGDTKRPWMQFSLKTIFFLMLLVSAYLAGRIPAEQRAKEANQRAIESERIAEQERVRAAITANNAAQIRVLAEQRRKSAIVALRAAKARLAKAKKAKD